MYKVRHNNMKNICKEPIMQHTATSPLSFYQLISKTPIISFHIPLKLWYLHTANQDKNHSRPSVCHHPVSWGWHCVLPLKATFPKQIFPIVKHRGASLKARGTHPKALSLCPLHVSLSERCELKSESRIHFDALMLSAKDWSIRPRHWAISPTWLQGRWIKQNRKHSKGL